MKTTQAFFTITGQFLTETVRQLVLERNWRHAMRVLKEIDGLTIEQSVAILSGKKKLIGTSRIGANDKGIELVEETAKARKAYEKRLEFLYSGVVAYADAFWRPYATVSYGFSEDDAHWAFNVLRGDERMNTLALKKIREQNDNAYNYRDWMFLRPLFYARDPQNDLCISIFRPQTENAVGRPKVDMLTLWEKVSDPPFWYELPMAGNFEAAWKNFNDKEHPHLNIVGAHPDKPKKVTFKDVNDEAAKEIIADEDRVVAEPVESEDAFEARLKETNERFAKQQEEDERRAKEYDEELARIKKQAAEFADNDKEFGWLEYTHTDRDTNETCTIRVPGRALICTAVHRAKVWHMIPQYTPFAKSGMKMYGDDPFHTDAWLGAGFSLDDAYNNDKIENVAFFKLLFREQYRFLKVKSLILTSGDQTKPITAHVLLANSEQAKAVDINNYDYILIAPTAGIEYDLLASKAKALIVERGGRGAHLVTVGRERGIPVLLIEDAMTKFNCPGDTIVLDPKTGEVKLSQDIYDVED
jgi:phosphohistidine swiveling domain-containing protein